MNIKLTEDSSIILLIRILFDNLSKKKQGQVKIVLILSLISSLSEMICLAAVVPFLSVLSQPEKLDNIVNLTIFNLNIPKYDNLLLLVTIFFIASNLFAGFIRIVTFWLNARIAGSIGVELSSLAFRKVLHQPYIFHLNQSTSSFLAILNNDINKLIYQVIIPLTQLFVSFVIGLGLLLTLLIIDPFATISSFSIIALSYFFAVIKNKKLSNFYSSKVSLYQKSAIRSLQEGFGAIRNVILDNSQEKFTEIYYQSERLQRKYEARGWFLSIYPKYIIESIGIASIALIGFILNNRIGFESAIPSLGALALGSMKMLSIAQKVFEGWSYPQNCKKSLLNIVNLLNLPLDKKIIYKDKKPLNFKSNIQLENVCFRYQKKYPLVLKDVNLTIKKGEMVGIIGTTGVGKSTLLDLIMGLVKPEIGKVLIDGKDLNDENYPETIFSWQMKLEHVPQSIFLVDKTIAENIAFDFSLNEIDFQRIKDVSYKAEILEFVEKLPNGFYTKVGERGVRLSGGQIQRIGIARALYKESDFLILDEATSALDELTERRVMNNLNTDDKNLTIIIIAHRLNTLKNCDYIYDLENKTTMSSENL